MGLVANIIVVDIRMEKKVFVCCESKNYHYMIEYVTSFIDLIDGTVLLIDSNYDEYNESDIYIFLQTIPSKLLQRPIRKMIINTEQMTLKEHNVKYGLIMAITQMAHRIPPYDNIPVFDYSKENIKLLNTDRVLWIPYQYREDEISVLKQLVIETAKIYDVVFIGFLSIKRKKIYDALVACGITILNVDETWGIDRDKLASQGKILLNIHYLDTYNIYESIRCDRWLFAGMMVVSEKSECMDEIDMRDLILFADYENIVVQVCEIVRNYGVYYDDFVKKHGLFMGNIVDDRKKNALHLNSYPSHEKNV